MLVVSVLVLALVPAAPATSGIKLVVSRTPGGPPARVLALPIRPQDTSVSRTFFVREADGRAVSGAVLYAAPPAGMSISFARPGGSDSAAALTIDLAAGASLDVTIGATWDDYGEDEVPLRVRTSAVNSIAEINVARPGGPPLTVVGAAPGTGLAIASTGPTLSTAITVATTDRSAEDVVASISDLRDTATGTSYPVEQPTVEVGAIEANATATVPLDAALPYNGSFTGNLRLRHDGISDPPVALTITRTLGPSGVTIDYVPTSSSTFDIFHLFGAEEEITRDVVLNETAGRRTTVDRPEFIKATGKVAEVVTGEADVDVVGVELAGGQEGSCEQESTNRITIEPGKQCRVEVKLDVPADAGQYDGTLRFKQPGYTSLDAGLSLQMRRDLRTAVVWIVVGLLVGGILKWVLPRWRSRLERLSKVERIARALEVRVAGMPGGISDDVERRTYVAMRARLATIADEPDPEQGGPTDLDAQLEAMDALVPVLVPWGLLRRAALAAEPPPGKAILEGIEAVGAKLADPNASKADADAQRTKIDELEKALRTHVTTAVRNEIERVKEQAGKWFEPAERKDLDAQFDRALAQVADETGSPEQARRELSIAQGKAAEAMSLRLHGLLDASTPPVAMDSAVWVDLQIRVRSILTGVAAKPPDVALEAVREADAVLLGGNVGAVTEKVRSTLDAYADDPTPAQKPRVDALQASLGHLDTARGALARGDLGAAHTAYDSARRELDQARTRGFLQGTDAEGVGDVPPLRAPPDAAGVSASDVPRAQYDPIVGREWLRRQWGRYEWVLFGLTVGVGAAVGVLALYAGKPTWGSIGDILAAFLWGVGLFAASNAAAQGFGGVRAALTS